MGLVQSVFWLQFMVTPCRIYSMNSSSGQLFSSTLVQSEFISSFSNSAHFTYRIPAWVLTKSLLDLRQHGANPGRSAALAFSQSCGWPHCPSGWDCQRVLMSLLPWFLLCKMGWLAASQGEGAQHRQPLGGTRCWCPVLSAESEVILDKIPFPFQNLYGFSQFSTWPVFLLSFKCVWRAILFHVAESSAAYIHIQLHS